MDFEIHPSSGVGPLRFGMTPAQAHAHTGASKAARVLRYPGSTRRERRETYAYGMHIVFTEPASSARLVELGFWAECIDLTYRGTAIFQVTPRLDVVRRIAADDPDVKELSGFLVFLKLGLTLTGFHDDRESDLAVTVFEPGRWDALLPSMKPFTVP